MEMWAHPVSFAADPAGEAARLAAAGIRSVRLAYTYHSGRWLLTTSRPGAVADLPSGAWFSTGDYPLTPPRCSGADAPEAAKALAAAGITTTAWLVGLHSTPLASVHPELAVRNVFGHRYRHALCPAQAAVRDYATALAADVAGRPEVTGLDLEAFGYLGWPHQSAHDKSGPLRPVDQWLLSLCVCEACTRRLSAHGVDVAELTARAAETVQTQLHQPRLASPDPHADAQAALGADLRDAVHRARDRVVTTLVADLAQAAAGVPVWLRASANRYACAGKSAGDLSELAAAAGRLMLTDFGGNRAALDRDMALAARVPAERVAVGWSLIAPEHAPGETTVWYAYDLAPASRLAWLEGRAR